MTKPVITTDMAISDHINPNLSLKAVLSNFYAGAEGNIFDIAVRKES